MPNAGKYALKILGLYNGTASLEDILLIFWNNGYATNIQPNNYIYLKKKKKKKIYVPVKTCTQFIMILFIVTIAWNKQDDPQWMNGQTVLYPYNKCFEKSKGTIFDVCSNLQESVEFFWVKI